MLKRLRWHKVVCQQQQQQQWGVFLGDEDRHGYWRKMPFWVTARRDREQRACYLLVIGCDQDHGDEKRKKRGSWSQLAVAELKPWPE